MLVLLIRWFGENSNMASACTGEHKLEFDTLTHYN